MNKTTWIVVGLALVIGLSFVPGTTAAEIDDLTYCQKTAGRNICVGVDEGGCDLWVSAGFGGCFIVPGHF